MKFEREQLTDQAQAAADKARQIAIPALTKTAEGLTTAGTKLSSTAEKLDDTGPSTLMKISRVALLGAGAGAVYLGARMAQRSREAQSVEGGLQPVETYPTETTFAEPITPAATAAEAVKD